MKFSVYIFLFISVIRLNAQDQSIKVDSVKTSEVLELKEEMPEYQGGPQKMMEFVQKTMVYPKKEKKKKIGGLVKLKFTVDSSGDLSNIIISQTSGNENLDNEAIRIVSNMPKWKPGKQNGKPIPVLFNLPVRFNYKN